MASGRVMLVRTGQAFSVRHRAGSPESAIRSRVRMVPGEHLAAAATVRHRLAGAL